MRRKQCYKNIHMACYKSIVLFFLGILLIISLNYVNYLTICNVLCKQTAIHTIIQSKNIHKNNNNNDDKVDNFVYLFVTF